MKAPLPLALALLAAALCGCASIHATKTVTQPSPTGTNAVVTTTVSMSARTLFSNTAVKGLTLDGVTKTTSQLLHVSGTTTEPNPESITATGSALGELIGTAAKTAATK